jgi:hypothetical protein
MRRLQTGALVEQPEPLTKPNLTKPNPSIAVTFTNRFTFVDFPNCSGFQFREMRQGKRTKVSDCFLEKLFNKKVDG